MQRPSRSSEQPIPPGASGQPASLLRRLREDPQDLVGHLAGTIGPRRATSLGEAQAAAYFDGRLRRAGLRVSVDTFEAPAGIGWDGVLIGLLGLASVLLYYWLPLPSLFLAGWNLGMAALAWWRPAAPLLQRRRTSQNVIATRAVNRQPRWRVVLLAPLDSPPVGDRWRALLAARHQLAGRALASAALVVLALGALFGPLELRRALWYLQFAPAAYLLLLGAAAIWQARAPASPGAANHAGALAALLQSAEKLANLQQTELWAVGVGATDGSCGLDDLLRRYPFDRAQTLFIGVESLGGGQPSYTTSSGVLRPAPADPLLLRLAMQASAADPQISATPHRYVAEPPLVQPLARHGLRTLTIIGLDAAGRPACRGSLADTPDQIDEQALDRSIRLVIDLVRRIDASEEVSQSAVRTTQ